MYPMLFMKGERHHVSQTTTLGASPPLILGRVRLEGLAVYLRRRRLRLRPHRQSLARGARRLPSATTTSPSPSSTEFGSSTIFVARVEIGLSR